MKNIWLVVVAVIGVHLAGGIHAQTVVSSVTLVESPPLPPLNLPLLSSEAVPDTGTFWLYSASSGEDSLPPFPYDPYGGVMPVFALPNGQFLIGDTKQDWTLTCRRSNAA